MSGRRKAGRVWWAAPVLASATVLGGCIGDPPPTVDPVFFEVDVDELAREGDRKRAGEAARALQADPDLHLLIVAHADSDNTEEYNHDLSIRRANHVRDLILAVDPNLAPRVMIQARGEWDPTDRTGTAEGKTQNRRVDFEFHYPRYCDPELSFDFARCELARLDLPAAPEPEPEPEPQPEPEPEPELVPEPEPSKEFIGPYFMGSAGYAVVSAELLRQYATWGVSAGYMFAPTPVFRLSAGASFDHGIDRGWVFDESHRCRGYCDEIKRPYVRLLPEVRFGAVRGRTFAYARGTAGIVVQQEEGTRTVVFEDFEPVVERGPRERLVGANLGIGPGVNILLFAGLFLGLDAQIAVTTLKGTQDAGAWIFDIKGSLGWQF